MYSLRRWKHSLLSFLSSHQKCLKKSFMLIFTSRSMHFKVSQPLLITQFQSCFHTLVFVRTALQFLVACAILAWVASTKDHKRVPYQQQKLFLIVLEAGKCKIKVLANLVCNESPLPRCTVLTPGEPSHGRELTLLWPLLIRVLSYQRGFTPMTR